MTSTLINISGKIDKSAIELYSTINLVAGNLKIPIVVVGAAARDIIMHYVYGAKIRRATMDIDFGIQVQSWSDYLELKKELIKTGFTETRTQHRLRSPSEMEVDIVPFGKVQVDEKNISWPHNGEVVMNVLGFQEACDNAEIVRIQDEPSVDIPVAAPAGLALLKIIAWSDRDISTREKDAKDLSYIFFNYDQIPGILDDIYKREDLLTSYAGDTTVVGTYLLGKEVGEIASDITRRFILGFAAGKIEGSNPERLIENMCGNVEREFEYNHTLFEAFMEGFNCSKS